MSRKKVGSKESRAQRRVESRVLRKKLGQARREMEKKQKAVK